MVKFLEGSKAIAEVIRLCRPAVIAAYPITPQTHIVEDLAKFKAEGRADYQYLKTESEMAAASAVLGASASGVRVYTASASQGLLLMTEVLYNIAGLRLPVVLTCANRAVSSPINIWNDEQDAMTLRDAGWIMLFAESNQEAIDLHIQAYKIAEATNLPVMVCVDGFSLTHTFESVDLPDQKLVDKFLPTYKPTPGRYLDPKNPVTLGGLSNPENYTSFRKELHQDLLASKKIMKKIATDFSRLFPERSGAESKGRPSISSGHTTNDGLVEYTGPKNPKLLLVAMGSVLGTIRHTLMSLRGPAESTGTKQSHATENVGLLKIKCFRPLPAEEISKIIFETKAKRIAVIDRAISLGQGGVLANEISNLCGAKKISSFILGLGGKDITPETIEGVIKTSLTQISCPAKFIE
jgi:pyruvate ferredoxin oxidoreductase alpha subunit